jgi:polyketide biosynthesis enoyl-CoA hydratase PksI
LSLIQIDRSAADQGVLVLRLDDPNNGNRIGREMLGELLDALATLADDSALKTLVLAGSELVFSGGATLQTLEDLVARRYRAEVKLPRALLSFPVPIVACLEGDAVGGGLLLALYSDVVFAAEERRYGFNFTSLGITPGGGTTRLLPAIVGPFFAAEMLLTGKFYRGRELAGRGLFNEIRPAREVFARAMDTAIRIAERPRDVLAMTRRALFLPRIAAFEEASALEHVMHDLCFTNPRIMDLIRESHFTRPAE